MTVRTSSWTWVWRAAIAAAAVGGVAALATWSDGHGGQEGAPLRIWAAAHVAQDGRLLVGREVDRVRRVGAGSYCLHIANPFVDLPHSVVLALAGDLSAEPVVVKTEVSPGAECQNAARTVSVRVVSAAGRGVDVDFRIAVM